MLLSDGTEMTLQNHNGFHGSNLPVSASLGSNVAITFLLPLFYDQAHSEAMVGHSIDVVKTAVDIL